MWYNLMYDKYAFFVIQRLSYRLPSVSSDSYVPWRGTTNVHNFVCAWTFAAIRVFKRDASFLVFNSLIGEFVYRTESCVNLKGNCLKSTPPYKLGPSDSHQRPISQQTSWHDKYSHFFIMIQGITHKYTVSYAKYSTTTRGNTYVRIEASLHARFVCWESRTSNNKDFDNW